MAFRPGQVRSAFVGIATGGGAPSGVKVYYHDYYSKTIEADVGNSTLTAGNHTNAVRRFNEQTQIFFQGLVHPLYTSGTVSMQFGFIEPSNNVTYVFDAGIRGAVAGDTLSAVAVAGGYGLAAVPAITDQFLYSPIITLTPAGTVSADMYFYLRIQRRVDGQGGPPRYCCARVWYAIS